MNNELYMVVCDSKREYFLSYHINYKGEWESWVKRDGARLFEFLDTLVWREHSNEMFDMLSESGDTKWVEIKGVYTDITKQLLESFNNKQVIDQKKLRYVNEPM